jgi:hypothetical protein
MSVSGNANDRSAKSNGFPIRVNRVDVTAAATATV